MSSEVAILDRLRDFETKAPDIISTAIVKQDGFVLMDTGKRGIDHKKYAAMTAGLYGISLRVMTSVEGGNLLQTYIKGEKTEIILMSIPQQKLFVSVIVEKDPNIGLIIFELEKLVKTINEVL